MSKGLFIATPIPWEAAAERAAELFEQHTPRLGLRSFDLLHVAAAMELGSREFINSDLRQAALAKTAGLKVTLVKRE